MDSKPRMLQQKRRRVFKSLARLLIPQRSATRKLGLKCGRRAPMNCDLTIASQTLGRVAKTGGAMSTVDRMQIEKTADVLFRYMRARHRFKERVERPLPAHELAGLLGGGKREFDEIYVEPEAKPPIVLDGKADDVFAAIIEKKYRALSFWDPQLVAAWSHYVISDGPLPVRPQPHRSPNPVGPPEAA